MFLVETDTSSINEEKDYTKAGYRTILPILGESDNKIRIMGLIKDEHLNKIKVRSDLMSEDFPSIWLEAERKNRRSLVIGGFYREWTRQGDSRKESQMNSLKIFTQQILKGADANKPTIVMGDANLCMDRWKDAKLFSRNHKATLGVTVQPVVPFTKCHYVYSFFNNSLLNYNIFKLV